MPEAFRVQARFSPRAFPHVTLTETNNSDEPMATNATTTVYLTTDWSDGDASKQPNSNDGFRPVPRNIYLEKVGQMWMEQRKEAEKGKKYILDRLPVGYQLFGKRRLGSTQVDRYLWGHPCGKAFRSPADFFPHFVFMMNSGNGVCSCALCRGRAKRNPARRRAATSRAVEDPSNLHMTLSQRLQRDVHLDEEILENHSVTWLANRQNLRTELARCVGQPAFIPRKGEMVLFYVGDTPRRKIRLDQRGTEPAFRFYDRQAKKYLNCPDWEAGIVIQVPSRDLSSRDLRKPKIPDTDVFKVAPYLGPDIGEDYLPEQEPVRVLLHQMRPLCFLAEMMGGINADDHDETIWQALDVIASCALVDKHRLVADWPVAVVHCRATWVGPELLACGDAVRIWDKEEVKVLDVESIELKIENLEGWPDEVRSGVWFVGRAYSSHPTDFTSMSVPEDEVKARLPRGMQGHQWYPVHSASQVYRASVSTVIGRCYEAVALDNWLLNKPGVHIGSGVVIWARQGRFSNDEGQNGEHQWYWADHRLEQLNVTAQRLFGMDEPDLRANPRLWRLVMVQTATEDSFAMEPNSFEMENSVLAGPQDNGQGVLNDVSMAM